MQTGFRISFDLEADTSCYEVVEFVEIEGEGTQAERFSHFYRSSSRKPLMSAVRAPD